MFNQDGFNINIVMAATRKLIELIQVETELLKAMKIADLKPIQDRKHELASILEKQQNILATNVEVRNNLTDSDKTLIKIVSQDLDNVIMDYQSELYKASKVNEFVIQKVAEVVREHVENKRSYNNMGSRALNGIELARNTPSIKFNEQI